MAILRCNHCGHVAETRVDANGQNMPCPRCITPAPVYDTVVFIRKVLDQYFQLRDELNRLKAGASAMMQAEPARLATATATTAAPCDPPPVARPPAGARPNQFALNSQFAAIEQWFLRRQIQIRPPTDAPELSPAFERTAADLGRYHSLLRDFFERIPATPTPDDNRLHLDLNARNAQEIGDLDAVFARLHGSAFLSHYTLDKPDRSLHAALPADPAILRFLSGEWLEWYSLGRLAEHFRKKGLRAAGARGLTALLADGDERPLDVFFLVNGNTPICLACRTGDVRPDIDTLLRLRKRLGIPRGQFIVCSPTLAEEQAEHLSTAHELSCVTPAGLITHIERLF
ncbi:MAG TPA: hypothetical protein PLD21_12245 [Rhodocyclaceae bacterium]|nr:hypothetical protein [Rhodocyclaceae bacterium]